MKTLPGLSTLDLVLRPQSLFFKHALRILRDHVFGDLAQHRLLGGGAGPGKLEIGEAGIEVGLGVALEIGNGKQEVPARADGANDVVRIRSIS